VIAVDIEYMLSLFSLGGWLWDGDMTSIVLNEIKSHIPFNIAMLEVKNASQLGRSICEFIFLTFSNRVVVSLLIAFFPAILVVLASIELIVLKISSLPMASKAP
jgi:hypothetical protein